MHEPYEARRFEREEKKGSVHYGWRSFVRALNENRTRGLPFRRRTLYPLSYKGVASFSRLGLMPDCVPPCRSNPFLLTGFQALSRGLSLQIG